MSSELTTYKTISQPAVAEFKDRGSKFIAYAYPVESAEAFKSHLQKLRKEHPKAVHHCFAYRTGTDGNSFRASDDGEPSGSAGKPILGQIDSRELTNIAIIVVRYFGGSLLGMPGLINAYKTASSLVLQITPLVTKNIVTKYRVEFDYTKLNEVLMVIRQCNISVVSQETQLFCNIEAAIPINRLTEALQRLGEIENLQLIKLD